MKKNLAIFFGGKSAEHEISIMSAKSVYENIDMSKYNVSLFGFDKLGEVYTFDKTFLNLSPENMFTLDRKISFSKFTEILISSIDVVFPILHGPVGEDGKIQGYLDFIGVKYIGCNVATSAVCMDKAFTKDVFVANGFNVAKSVIVHSEDYYKNSLEEIKKVEDNIGYPLFVKPCNMGSSVGISKVSTSEELTSAIDLALKYDDHLIIEKAINARELECGVLGNYGSYKATEVGEVVSSHEFYDYTAKYSEDELSDISIPAIIDEKTRQYIQKETIRAANIVGVSGLSRCDFLIDKDNGEIYISEINTMPGYTKFSMYPLLCEKIGYSYTELIDELVNLALNKRGV